MTQVKLDVRQILKHGEEPFDRIMNAVEGLGPEDELLLIAPFEPKPLFRVMANKGFKSECRQIDSGEYHVLITRG